MLGTEPRRLERYAHNLQRAIRAPDHGPLHRRWVANRTADATSIRPEILRSVRQIDSLALENPSISVPIGHSISRAELPSTTQNWQHCTGVFSRLAVRRLEGWPLARSRLWPSFETRAILRGALLRTRFIDAWISFEPRKRSTRGLAAATFRCG